ncbi:hypothetical protein QQM79_06815 [Marinobacteraceae bacterium S3BR75-40.1]
MHTPLITLAMSGLLWSSWAAAAQPLSDSDMSGLHIPGGDVLNVQGPTASGGTQQGSSIADISVEMLNQDDPQKKVKELVGPAPDENISRSSNPMIAPQADVRQISSKVSRNVDPGRTFSDSNVNEQGQLGITTSTYINALNMRDLTDSTNQIRGSYQIRNLNATSASTIIPKP